MSLILGRETVYKVSSYTFRDTQYIRSGIANISCMLLFRTYFDNCRKIALVLLKSINTYVENAADHVETGLKKINSS